MYYETKAATSRKAIFLLQHITITTLCCCVAVLQITSWTKTEVICSLISLQSFADVASQ